MFYFPFEVNDEILNDGLLSGTAKKRVAGEMYSQDFGDNRWIGQQAKNMLEL